MTGASAPTTLDDTGPAATVALVPWHDPDAVRLRGEQQGELRAVYGDEGTPEPAPSDMAATVLLRVGGEPVACGSLRTVRSEAAGDVPTAEVKRVYVAPGHRGRGLSRQLMTALEAQAVERGFGRLVLETGTRQPQAIGLYLRLGYTITDNYGEWVGVVDSRCFAKELGVASTDGSAARRLDGAAGTARLRAAARASDAETVDAPDARGLTLEVVPWTDPRASALRAAMFTEGGTLYPALAELMADGARYAAQDDELGAGVLATVLACVDGEAVGCASLQIADAEPQGGAGELKRVYVRPSARRLGVATALIEAVEAEARARGLRRMVLQTGVRQPDAVRRYLAMGYRAIVPYGPYADDALSLTFGKELAAAPV